MPVFEKIFARDPANPNDIASNATITLFDPADPNKTPVALTKLDGTALANPYTVNRQGEGPAFQHESLYIIGWEGGGRSNVFVSVEQMHADTLAARDAAETSRLLAQDAQAAAANAGATAGVEAAAAAEAEIAALVATGEFKGEKGDTGLPGPDAIPADEAVATYATTPGTATAAALSSTYARNGIYENFTEANFRKIRAAIARQYAGGTPARISVLGDSNSNGFQQPDGADYRRSYGERARSILDGQWGPSRTGLVYSRIGHTAGTFSRADNRLTLGTGWSQLNNVAYGPAEMGAVQGVGPTSGSLTYAHTEDVNSFDVWFKTSADSPSVVGLSVDATDPAASVVAADSFTTAGALTTTETGGKTWAVSAGTTGTWVKEGGRLRGDKLAGVGDLTAVANTGSADGSVALKRSDYLFDGLIFRYVSDTSYWVVAQNGSAKYLLAKKTGTDTTTVVGTSTVTAAASDVLSVDLSGTSITVKANGVTILTATDAYNSTATSHGIRVSGTTARTAYFDDFQHTLLGASVANLSGANGLKKVTISAGTVGQHSVNVKVLSGGTAVVSAVEAYDSTKKGLRWTLAGYSSGRAEHWNTVHADPWGGQNLTFTVAAPDLIVVNLMINAHNANQTPASYKTVMGQFIDSCKAVADVILVASATGGNPGTYAWEDYLNVLRELAAEKGCGVINLQDRWGPYSLANTSPYLMWKDPDHPTDKGYWDMGLALAEGVKLAAGRSA